MDLRSKKYIKRTMSRPYTRPRCKAPQPSVEVQKKLDKGLRKKQMYHTELPYQYEGNGRNLDELRRAQPNCAFSISTTLRVAMQVLISVSTFHVSGLVHRKLRTECFKFGNLPDNYHKIYMLPTDTADTYDAVLKKWPAPGFFFRENMRYASINAHRNTIVTPRDDLWSIFYIIVEMANGQLPWHLVQDPEDIAITKEYCHHSRLLRNLPREMETFLDYLERPTYIGVPIDYDMLLVLLVNTMRRLGINKNDPYDWEEVYPEPSAPRIYVNRRSVAPRRNPPRAASRRQRRGGPGHAA